MSVSELRCFDAVARTLNFSRAADLLGRTQPNITMQVASLEARYSVELFHRSRGGTVSLTDIGGRLQTITRQLLMLEEDATALLETAGELRVGRLRVGAIAPRSATRYLAAFRKRYPAVDVSISFGNSATVLEEVLACHFDVGILGGHGDHVECEAHELYRPEIVLLANDSHPAAARGVVDRAEFAQETLLLREHGSETRDLVVARMAETNYRPKAIIEIGSREGVAAAAAASLGIAAVSSEEIELTGSARILRFADFTVFGVMHAVCLKRRVETQLVRAFFSVVNETDGGTAR